MNSDERILGYPIRQLALDLGLVPDRESGDTFFAPGREEHTASLKIYPDKQQWRDYGAGKGGVLLDLILYCRPDLDCEAFGPNGETMSPKARAMDFLKRLAGGSSYTPVVRSRRPKSPSESRKVLVENWRPVDDFSIADPELLAYASRRYWDEGVLRHYCRQVSVSIKGTSHRHTLIGFPNVGHGYVLRGPGRHSKISTNQDVSPVDAEGRFTLRVMTEELLVFEGFGNFLAYLSHHILLGDGSVFPGRDVLVLNSWQNIARPLARQVVGAHGRVLWYGDNDKAGYKALEIARQMTKAPVTDMVPTYAGKPGSSIDDFNDFLNMWCDRHGIK